MSYFLHTNNCLRCMFINRSNINIKSLSEFLFFSLQWESLDTTNSCNSAPSPPKTIWYKRFILFSIAYFQDLNAKWEIYSRYKWSSFPGNKKMYLCLEATGFKRNLPSPATLGTLFHGCDSWVWISIVQACTMFTWFITLFFSNVKRY